MPGEGQTVLATADWGDEAAQAKCDSPQGQAKRLRLCPEVQNAWAASTLLTAQTVLPLNSPTHFHLGWPGLRYSLSTSPQPLPGPQTSGVRKESSPIFVRKLMLREGRGLPWTFPES